MFWFNLNKKKKRARANVSIHLDGKECDWQDSFYLKKKF